MTKPSEHQHLQFDRSVTIENANGQPSEVIDRVRHLLARGVTARTDPQRSQFFEIPDGDRVIYIHASVTGKILLLATWAQQPSAEEAFSPEPVGVA
jgi:hypothetical protein